jgi:hypothetical protein
VIPASAKVTLIGSPIAQDSFGKIYKEKVIDGTGNEREVIVKVPLRASGSME